MHTNTAKHLQQQVRRTLLQTLAEKTAWDLAKKHGFQLVTVNPVFVFGPVLSSRADATSVLMMKVMLTPPMQVLGMNLRSFV